MTREEAIEMLKSKMDGHTDTSYEWAETVRMAIKALEQESKTGHWKKIATYPLYECSKCKLESMLNTWDYCPNCGCRMIEPQESEK